MATSVGNNGDGLRAAGIPLYDIKNIDSHLEAVDGIMNDIEQAIRDMQHFIRQQANYQPEELGMIYSDWTLQDDILILKWQRLMSVEEILRPGSSRLKKIHESLQLVVSYMAIIERAEKFKDIKYKEDIEKEKAEIETKVKTNDKSNMEREFIVTPDHIFIQGMKQIPLEVQTNLQLLNKLKRRAERQRRRIQAALGESDFLLSRAEMLRDSIQQERFTISHELNRYSPVLTAEEIAEEANGWQQEQGATIITAAAIMNDEAEETTGTAKDETPKKDTEPNKKETEDEKEDSKKGKRKRKSKSPKRCYETPSTSGVIKFSKIDF